MKYIDFHCDALTKTEGVFQVTKETLTAGGCMLQCFAAFISARENQFAATLALCDAFDALCEENGYTHVRKASDVLPNRINAMLAVEEGGAVEGDVKKLEYLYERGVRLMTLTWNYPNELGHPNFPDYEGLKAGRISPYARETERGLTPAGREIVARMGELGMIVDVSHGSDALFSDVAAWSKRTGIPFVASHSGAAEICPWARNLTDEQIKILADCGGVVGLDFCADFLSADGSAEGQRTAMLAHAAHILDVGGEDILAIGSDFDGIPANAYLPDAAYVPQLLTEFEEKFGTRIAAKIAYGNALRVLKEVIH